jgi:phosphoesterase RecJ-like protein
MKKNNSFEEIGKVIEENDSFAIFSHANADGDAFGSSLGLGQMLKLMGKKVVYFLPEPVPLRFAFLPDYDEINKSKPVADVGIVVDAADIGRINNLSDIFNSFKTTINIDHHETNDYFADFNYVDKDAPSTSCLIYKLIKANNFPINKNIAEALYTGVLTDTGAFKYANATFEAFEIAGELVQHGANPEYVAKMCFESDTVEHLKLTGIALQRLVIEKNVGYSYITYEDRMKIGASEEDMEGIIDSIRKCKDIEVAVLFKEANKGEVRVSFRSKNGIDVKSIAVRFGGGGHIPASGCTVRGELNEVINTVIQTVHEMVGNRSEVNNS